MIKGFRNNEGLYRETKFDSIERKKELKLSESKKKAQETFKRLKSKRKKS